MATPPPPIPPPYAHAVYIIFGPQGQLVALALEATITGEYWSQRCCRSFDPLYLHRQPVAYVEKFLTARRLSSRDTEEEFDERVESYVNQ